MRARRTDANHAEIGRVLRQCGWLVKDVHELPEWIDFVICRYRSDVRLVEVKTDEGDYTPAQVRLMEEGWPIVTLRSVDDAIKLR